MSHVPFPSASHPLLGAGLLAALSLSGAAAAQTCSALELGGTSYVRVPNHASLSPTNITIEAWVYLDAFGGTIVQKGDPTTGPGYSLAVLGQGFTFQSRVGSGRVGTGSSPLFRLGHPVHVAVTWNQFTASMYVNGKLQGAASGRSGPLITSTDNLHIGAAADGSNRLKGKIDEVRIWRRALTAAQVLSNYKRRLDNNRDLVASWHFDRNSFKDTTGTNHGVGVGRPKFVTGFAPVNIYDRIRPVASGNGFPSDIKPVGDMNGDGFLDFAVGHASAVHNAKAAAGSVIAYSGANPRASLMGGGERGANAGDRLGTSVAGADLNQDGLSDVIMGAPGQGGRGVVRWRDSKRRLSFTFATGPVAGGEFGTLVATARLNSDAYPDVLVTGKDTLYAYNGRTKALLWRVVPNAGHDIESLAVIGDIRGNGIDDVVVGCPTAVGGRGNIAVHGGGNGSLIHHRTGAAGDQLGASLAAHGGDVDKDNVPDFAAGSPGHRSGLGKITIYSGRLGADFARVVGRTNERLGSSLAAAGGDVDGDGIRDLLWVNQNQRFVTFCKGDKPFFTLGGFNGDSAGFGRVLCGGDYNNDGRPDAIIGQPDKNAAFYAGGCLLNGGGFERYGAACKDSGNRFPNIVLDSRLPHLGGAYTIALRNGTPNAIAIHMLGIVRRNLPLTPIMPGCTWLVDSFLISGRATTKFGDADVTLPIPNVSSFVGRKLTHQWFAIDLNMTTPLPMVSSAGAEITIGR